MLDPNPCHLDWERTGEELAALRGNQVCVENAPGRHRRARSYVCHNVEDQSFDGLLAIAGTVRANEDSPATHISSTSTYDQVFLGTGHTTEWLGTFTVHRFDEALFGDDDTAASLACSDHRPISVPLRVPGGDDDR